MPHIHTEPGQHDHTASGFIIRTDGPEPRVLLIRHKKLGVWIQPGGHVELHETPRQAIAHELREETGYELGQLELLQPAARIKRLTVTKLHPVPVLHNTHAFDNEGNHFHTDIVYAFVTDQLPRHPVDVGESADFRWLTAAEMAGLPNTDTYEDIREIAKFMFDVCLPQWERVPTAEVAL